MRCGLGGAQNESRVMFFGDALRDFGVGVGASVRSFLARQRKHHAGVFAAAFRQARRLSLPDGVFDARPFAPQIDAGGGFHGI